MPTIVGCDNVLMHFDTFSHGESNSVFFLTHIHGDHLTGLHTGWAKGPLYCTATSARFLKKTFAIPSMRLNVLDYGQFAKVKHPVTGEICNSFIVCAIDATHCPGSAMFYLNRTPTLGSVLYTGDYRPTLKLEDDLADFNFPIDTLFVDGSCVLDYCKTLPTIDDTIMTIDQIAQDHQHLKHAAIISKGVGDEEVLEKSLASFPEYGIKVLSHKRLQLMEICECPIAAMAQRRDEFERKLFIVNSKADVPKRYVPDGVLFITPSLLWWLRRFDDITEEVNVDVEHFNQEGNHFRVVCSKHASLEEVAWLIKHIGASRAFPICPALHRGKPFSEVLSPMFPRLQFVKPPIQKQKNADDEKALAIVRKAIQDIETEEKNKREENDEWLQILRLGDAEITTNACSLASSSSGWLANPGATGTMQDPVEFSGYNFRPHTDSSDEEFTSDLVGFKIKKPRH